MKKQIIDFAVWYSGMEREKVLKAYHRYLKEKRDSKVTEALSQAAVSGSVCSHENQKLVETCVFCIDCKEFLGGAA